MKFPRPGCRYLQVANWLLIGIVDTVCELPEGEDKILWLARGQQLLAKLTICQRNDGHWPWRLDTPTAPPDSSVTVLVAYALARWSQANFAEAVFQPRMLDRARSAIEAVEKVSSLAHSAVNHLGYQAS